MPPRPSPKFSDSLPDPAFSVRADPASPIPVLIAVPHGGRQYPPHLVESLRHPERAALRLEDRLADELGEAVAAKTGAALVVAHAPRAVLDLNRAADDIDWGMIEGGVHAADAKTASRRARSGLGLVPRRVPGLGELWRGPLARGELEARIARIHAPYHDRLALELARLRERWGAALLLDLHSMPPLDQADRRVEYVLGDRFGASCDGGLAAASFAYFAERRALATHNRPYAGGYVLERHAAPKRGVHAIQLEVDRRSYLDPALRQRGPGFDRTVEVVAGLVRRLAAEVAGLGAGSTGWRQAAE